MSKREDGGYAFPVPDAPNHNGMTLRDYFAGQALVAEIHTACISSANAKALVKAASDAGSSIEQRIAFNSYRIADAMLAQRDLP